ncbi:ATP-binding protein [Staphylococcus condimenti]|nr:MULTISPECIES: ATP-binding protein [Staphylococcus]MDK8644964.1 ATP-binding protein [Staphylococcus condimenti]
MKLTNFRSFNGINELQFNDGLNFFVGNNNCGKTTVFKAVEFIQNGKDKWEFITIGKEKEEIAVEITLSGDDIEDIVNNNELKKYQNYIYEKNETLNITIKRSSKNDSVVQNGRKKDLDIKNIRTWNNIENQFENPTGIDKTINALFDAQFVYSDIKNEEYRDFGKTKVIGKLINSITKDFQHSKVYKDLIKAHEKAFGDEGLKNSLHDTEKELQKIISEQYGEAEVEFKFELPDMNNFLKHGTINLTENNITTEVSEKGTGMQRALAMSLIQVYSNIVNKENAKQLLFFIDEPETFLHPKAQARIINAFRKISRETQVFITTHSPYLLKQFDNDIDDIKIFKSESDRKVICSQNINSFPFSPTWGEINYLAFDIVNVEFFNELYGYLQHISGEDKITSFDYYLKRKGVNKTVVYRRNFKDKIKDYNYTIPTYIRNLIHHPENQNNQTFTEEQLNEAIETLYYINNNLGSEHYNK